MLHSPALITSGEVALAVAFWVLAGVAIASAISVVLVRSMFRAAIFLVLTFFGVAGLYVTLEADFLAAVQVLVYAGAISILLIFAVLFTRDVNRGSTFNKTALLSFLVASLVFVSMVITALSTDWVISGEAAPAATTASLADAIFNRYVLPFEIVGLLLLASIIGAIVLVRER